MNYDDDNDINDNDNHDNDVVAHGAAANSPNNDDQDSIAVADTYHTDYITIAGNGAVTDCVDGASERGTNKV